MLEQIVTNPIIMLSLGVACGAALVHGIHLVRDDWKRGLTNAQIAEAELLASIEI